MSSDRCVATERNGREDGREGEMDEGRGREQDMVYEK